METKDYNKQASDLLQKLGIVFTCKFIGHGKHFADDKESRDIYELELKRGSRSVSFKFGQSISRSGEYQVSEHLVNKIWNQQVTGGKRCLTAKEFKLLPKSINFSTGKDIFKNPNFSAPTEYDLLACLQKYDVGTFEDFCDEFGYSTDSKKAEKTYKGVKEEYLNVSIIFNEDEIKELHEIY